MVLSIFLHVLLNFTIILAHVLTQAWREAAWALSFSVMVHIPSAEATGLEKASFHSKPKKGNAKECSNYCTTALIAHASELMPKILQARLQQYVNQDVSDVQVGFRKGRGTRDQIANIPWIIGGAREI